MMEPLSKKSKSSATTTVHVTTYNVLSSHLCEHDYYVNCHPESLSPPNRYELLLSKLFAEIKQDSIICLQEISILWSGKLHVYFLAHGYHFITALYGNKMGGYMGVAIAVPLRLYNILHVDICCLGDQVPKDAHPMGPVLYKESEKKPGLWETDDCLPWTKAKDRKNQMITVVLQSNSRPGSIPFCVSTYHMPCMFMVPQVMMIHAALAVQRIRFVACGGGVDPKVMELYSITDMMPFTLTGDYNFMPDSPMYHMVTTNTVPADEEGNIPHLPPNVETLKKILALPNFGTAAAGQQGCLHSAYKVFHKEEPDYTNYSQVANQTEPFIGTLDFIFLSDVGDAAEVREGAWTVLEVNTLEHRRELEGRPRQFIPAESATSKAELVECGDSIITDLEGRPYPNSVEPSDHLLLSAKLSLTH